MSMIDFGYTINVDTQIDYDVTDKSIAAYVHLNEPTFMQCIGCGSCTSTCSAAQFTDFNIRKVTLLVRRGLVDGLSDEIAKCMFCGKCKLVCPGGVNTRNVILLVKQALAKIEKS